MEYNDFYNKKNYTIEDILSLIRNGAEENKHLEFKSSGAISDKHKIEISTDVAAFANADGGIIIYGLSEVNHKAGEISPIDGNKYTKEWLELVINGNIQRRIENLYIIPIHINDNNSETIYIVKIPKSNNAPHMSGDHRYYKRQNFQRIQLDEDDVRDLYNRKLNPTLIIDSCIIADNKKEQFSDYIQYLFGVNITNESNYLAENYKLNAYFHMNLKALDNYHWNNPMQSISVLPIDSNTLKMSIPSKEFLYPHETLNIADIDINIKKEYNSQWQTNLVIILKLLYPGGSNVCAYMPKADHLFSEEKDIQRIVDKFFPNLHLL